MKGNDEKKEGQITIDDIVFKVDTERRLEILSIIKKFSESKNLLFKFTSIGFVLGLIFALTLSKEFISSSTLFPEYSEENPSSLLGQFGGLAGIAGINLGGNTSLNPELYPTIVRSTPFFLELLESNVYYSKVKDSISVREYLENFRPRTIWYYVGEYTINIPFKIKSLFLDDNDNSSGGSRNGLIMLDNQTEGLIESLKDRIACEVNKKSGLINITVEMPDPIIAADVNSFTKSYIEEYLTDYKLGKVRENLEFLQSRKEEARLEFESAQLRLNNFRDNNLNIKTAKALSIEDRLNAEYQLTFGLYDELSKQVEQARIKVKEQTPVFKILQPPLVPNKKAKPRRMLIVFAFSLIGGICSIVYIFSKDLFKK